MDTIIEKLIEFLKEKASKKQILAVIGIIVILLINVPLEGKWIAMFAMAKICSITIIVIVGQLVQWNLDKGENHVEKNVSKPVSD